MANICEYCGKELAEGEECTCPQSVLMREMDKQKEKPPVQQAERPAEPQPEASPAAEEPADSGDRPQGQRRGSPPGSARRFTTSSHFSRNIGNSRAR